MALHKVEPSTYTPRFDFTGNRDMGGTQTATIKDWTGQPFVDIRLP